MAHAQLEGHTTLLKEVYSLVMQSRALVGRARRLTDTSEEQGRRFSKEYHAGASSGYGIGTTTASASEGGLLDMHRSRAEAT